MKRVILSVILAVCILLILITNVYAVEITSIKCPDFRSGEEGYIIVDATNSYDGGAFIPSVKCQNIQLSATQTARPIYKQNTEVKIPITGSIGSNTCQVTLTDVNDITETAMASVGCNILTPAMCTEGRYYSENRCIGHCVNGAKQEIKCCDINSEVLFTEANSNDNQGGYDCVKVRSLENDGTSNSNINFIPYLIGIVVILVIVIIALILRYKKK